MFDSLFECLYQKECVGLFDPFTLSMDCLLKFVNSFVNIDNWDIREPDTIFVYCELLISVLGLGS